MERLRNGEIPIFEPGLDAIVERGVAAGRLNFTTDPKQGADFGVVQFIAVGTPPDEDGSADLQYVTAVAAGVGESMSGYRVVITKSTVPVGTADKVQAAVKAALEKRAENIEFDVVSNPEFLKEGAAVNDFLRPDRIIVGCSSDRAIELMRELYAPFNRNRDRLMVMDVRSAELTKYAANAMLATKISFMNELANVAERVGADIENVRLGIGSDPRIGYHFIYPGCGYGGSCFPKDVKALDHIAEDAGWDAVLVKAVEAVNHRQKQVLFDKVERHFGSANLAGKTFAVWGLAFKPNTDDMREAPSRVLMESLWAAGAKVRAYDPVASEEAHRIYGDRDDLQLCSDRDSALAGADALVLVTEWSEFRAPDFSAIKSALNSPVVIDGRNVFDPQVMADMGFTYYGIGRGL